MKKIKLYKPSGGYVQAIIDDDICSPLQDLRWKLSSPGKSRTHRGTLFLSKIRRNIYLQRVVLGLYNPYLNDEIESFLKSLARYPRPGNSSIELQKALAQVLDNVKIVRTISGNPLDLRRINLDLRFEDPEDELEINPPDVPLDKPIIPSVSPTVSRSELQDLLGS